MRNYQTASTIYVSFRDGNDGFSGLSPVCDRKSNGPVKTLQQAFSMIGQFRKDGLRQPFTVKLMDEIVPLSSTLRIAPRADDRYSELTPSNFTVEPYGEGKVTLLGGEVITGFQPAFFNGVACLCADVPEAKDGWRFTDLYVGNDRAKMTRHPETGFFNPVDVENHATKLTSPSDWFIAKKGDIPAGTDLSDAVISFGHYWIDEHSAVESYDPKTEKVTLKSATRFTIAPEAGPSARMDYYIENLPFAFKNPGEWYLDGKGGKLYYIPKDASETAETLTVYAPKLNRILDIVGTPECPADGVRFRRIKFACTKGEYESIGYPRTHGGVGGGSGYASYTPGKAYASDLQACSDMHGAIQMTYAKNCVFENCDICQVGNHGLSMDDGCVDNRVESCHFYCLGAGALRISGGLTFDEPGTFTHGNVITNCHMEDGGRRHFAACGVAIVHSAYNEISHCSIHDFFYSGISAGFVWGYHDTNTHHNRFIKNHIYNLGKGVLSDMGGIYLLAPQPGTVVEGNVIHDVKCKVYGGWALYTDEGSSFITVENNVCYNCSSNCYHQHYGQYNVLRNNIFAYSGEELVKLSRREARLGLIVEGNIFYSSGSAAYGNPTSATLSSDRNLFYNEADATCPAVKSWEGTVPFAEVGDTFGFDENSLVADPLFRDPKNGDFTLLEGSPAAKIGFVPIDTSDVGHRF